ncbi:PepSY domain-containing protein [Ramlibacter sp.]|uniref:PepSY domain-containing protein n=1 Tax=Ramlibacter sp. TaxID=1917967 RepID=UPI002D6AED62|nr:PepSY domain-containing protein [Ramlibacter sp.]HYD75181.1 PepSY domain-containing protein [Ramlibacter sp.]
MPTHPFARLLPLLVAALALGAGPSAAWAGRHDDDHDRARAALQAGDVLPLDRVLQQVAQTHPGQVMAVELEREHERWVYELKLLQPGGALLKLEVDAKTGEVLRRKEKVR